MKNYIFLFLILPLLSFAQGNPLDEMVENTGTYKKVETTTINLTSSTKSLLEKKNKRLTIPIHLPNGTKEWFFRVTLLKKDSKWGFDNDSSYFYLLSHNDSVPLHVPLKVGVDFYVLSSKRNKNKFEKHKKYKYDKDCSYKNVRSFAGNCNTTQQPLWIGIKNLSPTRSLKIILEVVAYGSF